MRIEQLEYFLKKKEEKYAVYTGCYSVGSVSRDSR